MSRPSYGARAKLGIIVPPTNTVNEAEWNLAAPDGVSIHAARMALHTDATTAEGKAALQADLDIALHSLKPAGVAVIAYGCTAGSMISPRHALAAHMMSQVDLPCVTTAAAIVDALEALDVERISVATPYDQRLNDHEVHYLNSQGLDVVAIEGLGYGANQSMARSNMIQATSAS
ncbi:MAG: maleate cis-trans isomerase [Rhodospirillaceae bacterium]|jgi:maleate isomerase/arylmalonate decarboxylase|nr:maleate cis-trans isomerase [Rhodospirillaceae bacterium]|tara:strand:- start:1088 stop:1612 length:525 start_codon:yes stop_codon:yes gene_type:complete